MRKNLFILFSLMVIHFGSNAATTKITVDGLAYNIDTSTGSASVASQNKNTELIKVSIPDSIEYETKKYVVKTISTSAFSSCTSLTTINIPASVTTIGNTAFSDCTALRSIILEDGETTLNLGYNSTSEALFYDCPIESIYLGRDISYKTYTAPAAGSVTISHSYGYSPFYNKKTLKSILIGTHVSSLGSSLFSGCSAVTSISIPASVIKIYNSAFNNCTSIKSIIFENGEKTLELGYNSNSKGLFKDCPVDSLYLGRNLTYTEPSSTYSYGYSPFANISTLSSLEFGDSITTLSQYAFRGCTSLESVIIPNTINSLDGYNFYDCTNLKSVTFKDAKTTLKLGVSIFNNCENITDIYVGRDINTTGTNSFVFPNLNLTIGENVTELTNWLSKTQTNIQLISCKAITPPTVVSFSDEVYQFAKVLVPYNSLNDYTTADIWKYFWNIQSFNPESQEIDGLRYIINSENKTAIVTYQQQNTLDNYKGLLNVTIPETIEYQNDTYTIVGIGNEAFNNCWSLKSISLPETIESIEELAFGYCTQLRSISLPDAITTIGNEAFTGCSALATMTLGKSVETIGSYAFFGCTGLSEISVPASVKSIADNAFMGVHWLTDVYSDSNIPSDADASAFSTTAYQQATLHIPAGSLALYEAHPTWSKFLSIQENNTMDLDRVESDTDWSVYADNGGIDFLNSDHIEFTEVFSSTGALIYSGSPHRIEVSAGVYIVRCNKTTRKILVK